MPRRHRSAPAAITKDYGFSFSGALWFICKLIIFIYLLRLLIPVLGEALR
jgi:hypothetical protein